MTVFDLIVDIVEPGSRVLDLGCDDCTLLARLRDERDVSGRGVDIDEGSIRACIKRGISVFHGDLDEGLRDYPDASYDYVILSRTIQQVRHPATLMQEMVRVGRRAIVNFPNFAFWRNRLQLAIGGVMPMNRELPYTWYETPNIHFCTARDFSNLCNHLGIGIERTIPIRAGRRHVRVAPNLRADEVCCVLQR